MIQVESLRKEYGDLTAVAGIDFIAEPGAIFGLLGPNGAGKSTTIGCISGLVPPTGGRILVDGHDIVRDGRAAKASLGIVPQELALYEDLSAHDNLSYWGAAYGLRGADLTTRVEDVLQQIGLLDRAKEPVKNFSGGMKRRLNFGCGIVHRPRVLLLDEPTVGVDPQSRVRLLDLVREQANRGTCVLYTTHYMGEAEELCNRLAIIDHGQLLASGTLNELRELMGERDLLRLQGSFEPERVAAALAGAHDLEIVTSDDTTVVLAVEEATRRLPELFTSLERAGATIQETTLKQPSLESLFIKLTGRELRE
jgi:ABC-2 type transport system ATP-binding protein